MAWELDSKRSIYLQLMERLRQRIITGAYPPGGRLPAVRELAEEAGVNPNTMQRAMLELEREGCVYSQRTSGRFVTEDTERIEGMRIDAAKEATEAFVSRMKELGFSREEVRQFLSEKKEAE